MRVTRSSGIRSTFPVTPFNIKLFLLWIGVREGEIKKKETSAKAAGAFN